MTASLTSARAERRLRLRLGSTVLVVALGFWGAGSVLAQPSADPAQDLGVLIKGFQVMGDNPLPDEETTRVLAGFLRKPASVQALQQATTALEAAMAAKGHALHRVILPPQELGDVVRFEIVRFAIGSITVTGAGRYDTANIRRSLPELQEGGAPNFHRLALQTALANENPGKQTQISFKEGAEPDRIDATVVVAEQGPVQWTLGLANTGAASSGRDRFTVAAGHANLWGQDHQLNAAYTTSLARAGDVSQLGGVLSTAFLHSGRHARHVLHALGCRGQFWCFHQHRCRAHPGPVLHPLPAYCRWSTCLVERFRGRQGL